MITALFIVISVSSQNLVKNPSFEEHWFCPPAITIDSFPCKYWRIPNKSTPDYYHSCSRDPQLGVPQNAGGYYVAHTGNAYIGLGLISLESAKMEHIQGELVESLKKSKNYKISFWVRLEYQCSDYGAYNIGAFLSEKKILTGNYWENKSNYIEDMTSDFRASVSNTPGNFIMDTTWVEISGIYIAKGGEKYITIGMFWDDDPKVTKVWNKVHSSSVSIKETKRLSRVVKKYMVKKNPYMEEKYKHASFKTGQHFPYYFIDDVSVIEIKQ